MRKTFFIRESAGSASNNLQEMSKVYQVLVRFIFYETRACKAQDASREAL